MREIDMDEIIISVALHQDKNLIALWGLNCSLCVAYQFREHDINKHGFHRGYCPGCIPRDKNCMHMADACEKLETVLYASVLRVKITHANGLKVWINVIKQNTTWAWLKA